MSDRPSNVHDLHPRGNRLALRAQAAEQLIQATDPAQTGHALFDLIAAELKLNAFLLYALADGGCFELIAHDGLSEAEAATAATMAPPFGEGGERPGPVHFTGVQGWEEEEAALPRSIGLKACFSLPLMAGDRLLGCLLFGRRWADCFDEEELLFLGDVGNYLALALERVRWETTLRESEARLRLGMTITGFHTFEMNLVTGGIIYLPEAKEKIGYPPDQVMTIDLLMKVQHPDDHERVHAAWLASQDPEGAGEFDEEFRIIRPSGAVRWMHVRSQTFFAGKAAARRAVRVVGASQDITESKLAEQRLRESEERLRFAVEAANMGVFDFDIDTNKVIWSPELKEIYGIDADEVMEVEKAVRQVHPDDRGRIMAPIEEARAGRSFVKFSDEYRITRRDGALRWLTADARLLFNPGSPDPSRRMIGIVRDITERKLAEQRLRESEERLRLAIEAARMGVFEYDVDHNELVWSPELKAIHGLDPDEPMDIDKAFEVIHPDDRARLLAPVEHVRAGGHLNDVSEEMRIFRRDGALRWLALNGRLLPSLPGSDQPRRTIGVMQDITERKLAEERLRESEERLRESEERLQLAQEKGGVASFEWDPATGEIWVSESYRQIYGLPPAGPVKFETWLSLVHPDDQSTMTDEALRPMETGQSEIYEYRIIRPSDQEMRWIYSVIGVLRDPSTNKLRLAGVALDVTERKHNEERERLLSREVDHRAKNLLSVVQAMVQLTHADTIPEFIELIKGRIHALGRAHSLLASSRWSGAELSRLIAEEFAPFTDEGDCVRLDGPPVALRPAAAQSMALVIHELTTNAAKYGALSTPDGRIEMSWETGKAVAGQLVLRWRESGGPPVTPPRDYGFGLTHIRGSIERQLGGTIALQWRPEGLECVLSLPARQIVERPDGQSSQGSDATPP